jgi:hypothetical protein
VVQKKHVFTFHRCEGRRYINSRYIKNARIRMQRCVKISKPSVKNFWRFKIRNKRTVTFLFI